MTPFAHLSRAARAWLAGVAVACALALALVALPGRTTGPVITWTQARPGAVQQAPLRDAELLARSRVGSGWSAAFLFLVAAPFAAMFLVAASRAWRHAKGADAERRLDPKAPLADGPAVVFGVVEADGPEPVVTLRIHQVGREWRHKGAWNHEWKERSRDVRVRPFTLARADGVQVRVEPDERLAIHDGMLRIERLSVARRDRVAEVLPGAEVHVSGVLDGASRATRAREGAYREAGTPPVLRPPRPGRMIVSTEHPGDTEGRQSRFHALAATGLLLALATFGCGARDYLALVVGGQRVTATVTDVGTWRTWDQPKYGPGRWVLHDAVRGRAVLPNGTEAILESPCGPELAACVDRGRCGEVPFVVSPRDPSNATLGTRPTLSDDQAFPIGFLALLLVFLYPAAARAMRPWYVAEKVNDRGSGRLSSS